MATVHGVLGQAAPAATTLSVIYTVPASKHATAKILACNRGAATSFRIALSPLGAAIADQHYVAYDQALAANEAVSSVVFTVTATDVVRIYSTSGNVSFTMTGIEDDN